MAFKREFERKGLALTGLIDIIFLLLIFFMATLNMSSVVSDRNRGIYTQKLSDLPEIRNRQTGPVHEILQTLMIQIEHEDAEDLNSPLVVYSLWPDIRDSLTVSGAKMEAVRQKRYAYFIPESDRKANPDVPDISPYVFIEREIKRYADRHLRARNQRNYIEVRAIKETEYRVINHILNACAELKDRIPRIYIRTLSGELSGYAF